ncbi:hypothetical protein CFREI_01450 [Corynebacterium freiburgense]|nr:hypothetical protein CFREI_01450 [Corynebacterium freiburgense]
MARKVRLDSFIAKPLGFLTLCAITIAAIVFFKSLGIDTAALVLILIPSIFAIPFSLLLNIQRMREQRTNYVSSTDN